MTQIPLSNYVSAAAAKRLAAVEIDKEISHQHELNGVNQLKIIFGETSTKIIIPCTILYVCDDTDKHITEQGSLTWYDARLNHPTRSEYRLYYSENTPIQKASKDDLLLLMKMKDGQVLVIVAQQHTDIEAQLLKIFGFGDQDLQKYHVNSFEEQRLDASRYIIQYIFDALGIDLPAIEEKDLLTAVIKKYPTSMPSTREFSAYVFSLLTDDLNIQKKPDESLIRLLELEEMLFKVLEKNYYEDTIKKGFNTMDDFIKFALGVMNRRKSRAGQAFENHLESIFKSCNVHYTRTAITENNSKPDFIFPGITSYHNKAFPVEKLTMLGVKTSCKDRWRQILSEAARIEQKHLATLQPAISRNQTAEMASSRVALVIPSDIHSTYSADQLKMIISIEEFVTLVKRKQK